MPRPTKFVQQRSLALLGNLLCDGYDVHARSSLELFVAAGGLPRLVALLAASPPTDLFAAATLLNVTSLDPRGSCDTLRGLGAKIGLGKLSMAALWRREARAARKRSTEVV